MRRRRHEIRDVVSGVVRCTCTWKSNHNALARDSYDEFDRHVAEERKKEKNRE